VSVSTGAAALVTRLQCSLGEGGVGVRGDDTQGDNWEGVARGQAKRVKGGEGGREEGGQLEGV
jgi:hypothetical protein